MSIGIYYQLYALLSGYLYGADAVLTGDQTLTLTLISTLGALVVIVTPFAVVFWGLKRLFG